MKHAATALALALALCASGHALADVAPIEADKAYLFKIREINIIIDDQVKGGCWTNAGAVENAALLELERSGLTSTDEHGAVVFIEALGSRVRTESGRDTANCHVALHFEILAGAGLDHHAGIKGPQDDVTVLTQFTRLVSLYGQPFEINEMLKAAVIEEVQYFLVERSRFFNSIKETEPHFYNTYR
ncbi:MAG: hypothetical protein WD341_15905 [Tistlia sp.]|uniref:hypothetical protein n=1 Tax=Tistlia sp. TaxID=3057121 RepID=UPI0034A2C125